MSESIILVDLDNQDTSDEFAIDYHKIDYLKSYSQTIYDLFKVSIEYGEIVKTSAKTSTKDMKQWITLFGDKKHRNNAKKYITSLCNPEFEQRIKLDNQQINKLEKKNLINKLSIDYQTYLEIIKSELIIKGKLDDVTSIKCIIDLELNLLPKTSTVNSQQAKNSSHDDDDIICLDNDPYEAFDESVSKKKQNNPKKLSIENSLKKLHFESDNNSMQTSFLTNLALSKGFKQQEIDQALQDLGNHIGETEFIGYLTITANFQRNDKKIQKTDSNRNKEPSNKKINFNKKSSKDFDKEVELIEVLFEPKNASDCEVIEFVPKESINASKSVKIDDDPKQTNDEKINFNQKKPNHSAKLSKSEDNAMDEYAFMFHTQEFDKENEEYNKQERISKLLSVMPDNQKKIALHQFNNYKNKNSKKNNEDNERINNNQNSNNNILNFEPNAHGVEINKSNSTHQIYNPTMYQDSNLDHENINYLMSNFNDLNKNNSELNYNINPDHNDNEIFDNNQNSNQIKKKRHRSRRNGGKSTERNINQINNRNVNDNFKYNSNNYQRARSQSNRSKLTPYERNNDRLSDNNHQTTSNQTSLPSSTDSNDDNLRFIVIDGSNVAIEHGKEISKDGGKLFSCKGLKIVVDYFLKRGHKKIKALVPRFRRGNSDTKCPTVDPEILDELEEKGFLTYTPSRRLEGKLIFSYDDKFILNAALHYNGIIVSNDNYRDLMKENIEWKNLVEKNLLQYSFIGDLFMVADDPMGRQGPHLDQFLSLNFSKGNKNSKKIQPAINYPVGQAFGFDKNANSNYHHKNSYSNEQPKTSDLNSNKNFFPKFRDSDETNTLYTHLIDMFPNSDLIIKELLDRFRNQKDINFFVTKLTQ